MFDEAWRIVAGSPRWADESLHKLSRRAVKLGVLSLALTLMGWAVNITGYDGLNFIPFFVIGAIILILGFAPIGLTIGASAGSAFAALKDEDISQGVAKGLLGWCKLVLGILIAFWAIFFFLATWSFQNNPLAFFPVAAGVCLLTALSWYYGAKTKWATQLIVTTYTVSVIAFALFTTLPPAWTEPVTSLFDGEEKVIVTRSVTPAEPTPASVCTGADNLTINSKDWSRKVFGKKLGDIACRFNWTRYGGPNTTLLVRINGDDSTTKKWVPGTDVTFGQGIHFVQFTIAPEEEQLELVTVKVAHILPR